MQLLNTVRVTTVMGSILVASVVLDHLWMITINITAVAVHTQENTAVPITVMMMGDFGPRK